MTPKVLEELINALPASERAALVWAPRAIRSLVEQLFSVPRLSSEVLDEVTAAFLQQLQSVPNLVHGLALEGHEGFAQRARPLLEEQLKALEKLPVASRRAATRALTTTLILSGIGVGAIEAGFSLEQVVESANLDRNIRSGAKAAVAVVAILHGIETGRAREPRTLELVAMADAEARRIAMLLADGKPDEPRVHLGWYFEGGQNAHKYRSFALWAEPETSKNDRLVEMLEEWKAEPEEPGEAETWEELKRALDEDRPSNRPLFP